MANRTLEAEAEEGLLLGISIIPRCHTQPTPDQVGRPRALRVCATYVQKLELSSH